jgi:hypothetical protein
MKDIQAGLPPAKRPRKLSAEIGYFWDQLQACWDEDPAERPNAMSTCRYLQQYRVPLAEELQSVQDLSEDY